jgi:predicted DNA-binding transcriptional regulator AlpA
LYAPGGPFYGASRSTVWGWIASGRLPTIKLGPRITAVFVEDARALMQQMPTTSRVAKVDTS